MSASNWSECPRCRRRAEKAVADAKAAYGTVGPAEYHRLLDDAVRVLRDLPPALREDYSQGVHDGKYYVRYHAECQTCGFEFRHRDERPVDVGE